MGLFSTSNNSNKIWKTLPTTQPEPGSWLNINLTCANQKNMQARTHNREQTFLEETAANRHPPRERGEGESQKGGTPKTQLTDVSFCLSFGGGMRYLTLCCRQLASWECLASGRKQKFHPHKGTKLHLLQS